MKETIPQLIVQFRSWILITVTASGLLAFTVSLFLPKEYLSEASVLPANSKMMDKQAMFGSNIQELYSAYGEAEDLDRLMATLHSPTVLQFVSDSLDLSSHYNVKVAREKGFHVYEGKLEDTETEANSYDLVFSNNVIQHVNSAKEFMQQLKSLVKDDGVIVITCPDGSRPNIEILWSDQNFSFLPANLMKLAEDIGFKTVFWTSSADSPSLPPAQLLLMTNNKSYEQLKTNRAAMEIPLDKIFRDRSAYLQSFEKINSYIAEHIADSERVYNFGASYWTSILAAYCPDYWKKVVACLVDEDQGNSKFLGKDVSLFSSIKPGAKDVLVIGTGPGWQKNLKEKLSKDWQNIVTWDSFINY